MQNDVPSTYFSHLDNNGQRRDRDQRPELARCSVEFVAPSDYMVGLYCEMSVVIDILYVDCAYFCLLLLYMIYTIFMLLYFIYTILYTSLIYYTLYYNIHSIP